MRRILSGVQPTGNLHLGNYLGAIRNWVKGQGEGAECLYMLADLHAITVAHDPEALRKSVRETAAAFIACGIDPKKSVIFNQSAVSGHAELSWILSCYTPLGWLNRMTQYKEKAKLSKDGVEGLIKFMKEVFKDLKKDKKELQKLIKEIQDHAQEVLKDESVPSDLYKAITEREIRERIRKNNDKITYLQNELLSNSWNILKIEMNYIEETLEMVAADIENAAKSNLGLYSYPTLMAADILVYKATHVPVGHDQKQHLELSRDIAGAFNRYYNREYFPLPEPQIMGEATRVMSLRDGTKKMSKSDESDYSRINLTDDADTIAKKFAKAKSDSFATIGEKLEERPDITNLLVIYAALKGVTFKEAVAECGAMNSSTFKKNLTDVAVAHLSPITARMRELLADPGYIDGVIAAGVGKARALAANTMKEVKDMVGFISV
jgi:tryptophanyl-tRNA synthetase